MKNQIMDWNLVIILSSIGLIMGLLSVKGFTQVLEPYLWLLFGIAVSLILSKNIEAKSFQHGLFIGLAWGILNGLTQCVFFNTYLANNPQLQQNFQKLTFMQPRFFALLTGPVIGLLTGLALGGLAWLFKKLW